MKVAPYELSFPLALNDANRGKGLHASDIYGSYYKALNPKKYGRDMDPFMLDLLFAIGLAWEQYLEKTLIANGELCARPGELAADEPEGEVKYSPDLLLVNGHDRIGEIKATYMSSRTCVPGSRDFEKYLSQIKLYCGWTEIPRARAYVLYIHGDWRRKLIDFKAWDFEFTKRDLADEHKVMMNHARDERLWEAHRPVAGTERARRNKR